MVLSRTWLIGPWCYEREYLTHVHTKVINWHMFYLFFLNHASLSMFNKSALLLFIVLECFKLVQTIAIVTPNKNRRNTSPNYSVEQVYRENSQNDKEPQLTVLVYSVALYTLPGFVSTPSVVKVRCLHV